MKSLKLRNRCMCHIKCTPMICRNQKFTRDSPMRHAVPSDNLRPPSGKAADKRGYKGRPKSEQKSSLDESSAFAIPKLCSESLKFLYTSVVN